MAKQPLTDLDRKLQEIALLNWNQFVALVGEDSILAAKICILRKDKFSYGQIHQKLEIKKHQVRYAACNKCD